MISLEYEVQASTIPMVIDDMTLAVEYETNGIFSRGIDALPDDALRHGYDLGIADDKIKIFITTRLEKLEADNVLTEAGKSSRLFGGAVVVMFVDDGRSLEEPLDIQNAHKIVDLRMYDRTQAIPDYSAAYRFDPENPSRTGKPKHYDITIETGGNFKVHYSRCLIFTNGKIVSQSVYQQYRFWGIPEMYRVQRPLKNYLIAQNATPKMVERSSIPIYKTSLKKVLSADREGVLRRAVRMLSRLLRFDRVVAIDNDTEDFTYANASFSGVQEAIRAAQSDLAAVWKIPQTKLFGSSPGGMQATGESDTENWHSEVEAFQAQHLKNPILTLVDLIIREGIFSGKLHEAPEIDFKFNPLKVLSALEQANLDKTNADTAKIKADTAEKYCDMGALDGQEIRKGLAEDSEYSIEDLLDNERVTDGMPNLQKLMREDCGISTPYLNRLKEPSGVGVIIISTNGKTVLCGIRKDNGKIGGAGGWIEPGETPRQAAIRETQEEFGITPENLNYLGKYPTSGHYSYVFSCTKYSGKPSESNEMTKIMWLSPDKIAQGSTIGRVVFEPFQKSMQFIESG